MAARSRAWISIAIVSMALLPAGRAPAAACDGVAPTDPVNAVARITPEPPGTEKTYCMFFGPYTIPPGHDLSRVDVNVSTSDGFIVAGGPTASLADGSEPSTQQVHIHHAHWWQLDPNATNYGPSVPFPGWAWIAGSGEEKTNGDFRLVAAADPDPHAPRYGIATHANDRVLLINMVHNKTSQSWVVWIKVQITYVHGSSEQIRAATGHDYHALTAILDGATFDVPRGAGHNGIFTYPFDASGNPNGAVVPGVGLVWKVPFSGTIVIGASHLHPGASGIVFTNRGQESAPCANDRSDGIPGTTLYELDVINRTAPFSEDFQIEITQPGFRADVQAGDELVLNGIYESAQHGWWAAMEHTGFYIDQHPVEARTCAPRLVGTPAGWTPALNVAPSTYSRPIDGIPNRPWTGAALAVCGAAYGTPCDRNFATEPAGVSTDTITISGLQFYPGGLGLSGPLGPPLVKRGTQLRVVNTDFFPLDIRHTMTSCPSPCDGNYWANYPLPDGNFDSGFLGYEPTTGGGAPEWQLNTARLSPGRYTYFCRIHPWMRGSFQITA